MQQKIGKYSFPCPGHEGIQVSGYLHVPDALPPGKKPKVPIQHEAWRRMEKFLATTRIRASDRSARRLVAVPTTQLRLPCKRKLQISN
jgi:hypothetical protein